MQTDTREGRDEWAEFRGALDELRRRTEARLGAEDVAHLRRMRRISIASEVIGRALVHMSLDPASFLLGVGALFVHK